MKKDKNKTDMVFRTDKNGVFALFPHEVCDMYGHVTTYQRIGQHGSADYRYCIAKSHKATKEQYTGLKKELEDIGYNINVVQRQSYIRWKLSLQMIMNWTQTKSLT